VEKRAFKWCLTRRALEATLVVIKSESFNERIRDGIRAGLALGRLCGGPTRGATRFAVRGILSELTLRYRFTTLDTFKTIRVINAIFRFGVKFVQDLL
jgi:hypothetical protein